MQFPTVFLLFGFFFITFALHCPPGSNQIPNEDLCIFTVNTTELYTNVIRKCSALGAQPVKISNIFENAYITATLTASADLAGSSFAPYIGVEKQKSGQWTYSDGTPLIYQNWALNEPNNSTNSSSYCAIVSAQNGQWYSAECTYPRPYLCSATGDAFQCPTGWVYNEQTDYCYYLQNYTSSDISPYGDEYFEYNVTMAETFCQRMSGHLVSIHSKAEDDFIYDLVYSPTRICSNPCVWIGYYGDGLTGTWTDGSQFDYNGYGKKHPNGIGWWMTMNNPVCETKYWDMTTYLDEGRPRFLCKAASKIRMAKEKKKSEEERKKI